jgi:hypothetical protein
MVTQPQLHRIQEWINAYNAQISSQPPSVTPEGPVNTKEGVVTIWGPGGLEGPHLTLEDVEDLVAEVRLRRAQAKAVEVLVADAETQNDLAIPVSKIKESLKTAKAEAIRQVVKSR